ncbi:hypothetical protein VTN49DRAFT_6101 [Thermomyces lanuginosus]|uniref:uncharacterized protein n=1 Tax=Thermomyces lanuginosus TaxID=5541 RepID=UPI00374274E7
MNTANKTPTSRQLIDPSTTLVSNFLPFRHGSLSSVRSVTLVVTMPQAQPELKKYMEKRLFVQLNGNRKVIGVLRGYDVFMNIVLDEAVEEKANGEKEKLGMVVIRGNSVVMLEALERIMKRQKKRAEARIQILLITMLVMGRLGFLVFITMELILGAGYLDRCMQCFK